MSIEFVIISVDIFNSFLRTNWVCNWIEKVYKFSYGYKV